MSSTKKSRALAKQQQISSAAQQLFLEKGFSATSMDMIASEAKVSKQTLYRYFSSKEDLLVHVLQHLIQQLSLNSFSLNDLSLNTLDELQQILEQIAERFITTLMQPEYLALTRIIIAEITRFPQLGELYKSTVAHQVLQHISAILQKAHEQGLVVVDDVEIATRMFIGPFNTYAILDGLLVVDRPHNQPDKKQISKMTRSYLNAITPRK